MRTALDKILQAIDSKQSGRKSGRQRILEDGWQDWRIVDIESRYMEINAYYVDMIRSKMKPGMLTVLCSHHLSHEKLNGHTQSLQFLFRCKRLGS